MDNKDSKDEEEPVPDSNDDNEPVPATKRKMDPAPSRVPTRRGASNRRPPNRRRDCPPSEPTSPKSCGLPPVSPENSLPPESAATGNEHNESSAQSLESTTAGLPSEETATNNDPVPDKVPVRRSSIGETATNDLVPGTSTNESTLETNRSITPNSPVPLENRISPRTANEIRCTIRALFPNGPPKPSPIIPVRKYKKGDTPYIVGCTKRKRVPESKTLKVFKGDGYGITSKTNALDDEDAPLHSPPKRSRITYNGKKSKSTFNNHSDEIAARLKRNDETWKVVDDFLSNPSQNGSTSFMSNQHPTRLSEFSPIPSTSKDSKTIQKNENNFTDIINASKDNDEASDDEDLPAVILTTSYIDTQDNKKKKRKVQNLNLNSVTVTTPTVINDIISQINSDTYLKEIDFHGIFKMNKSPNTEDFFDSNRCLSPIVIEDENMNEDELQPDTAMKQDDIIEIKDNITQNEISEIKENAMKQSGIIDIKDNTLNYSPKEEKIVDFDEIFAEYEAYKRERGREKVNSANIINIVNPITLEVTKSEIVTKTNSYQATTYRNTVDLVTPHAVLSDDKGDEAYEAVLSTPTINNNMADLTTPLPAVNLTQSNIDEVCKSFPSTSSKKDNTVDLPKPQSTSNKPEINEFGKKDPSTATTIVEIVDLENFENLPSTSPIVINIPDAMESAANASLGTSTRRYWWSDDVEIVSETLPVRQGNTRSNNDVEIVEEKKNGRSDLNGLQMFLAAEDPSICSVLGAPHLTGNEPANPPTSVKINEERSAGTEEVGLGDCPICLGRLLKTSLGSTTCGHVFCLKCLKKSLKRGKRCPTCRKVLKGTGYTQLYL